MSSSAIDKYGAERRVFIATGFGYCNVEAEHGVSTIAFANGHGPGVRGDPMPDLSGWGDAAEAVRLGYEEGRKLRTRDDLDGLLPAYIVGIHYGNWSWKRLPQELQFAVRAMYRLENGEALVMSSAIDKYVAECFADNAYLKGDDCKRTRMYLLGWITSLFRRGEGRIATADEERAILAKIETFLKERK